MFIVDSVKTQLPGDRIRSLICLLDNLAPLAEISHNARYLAMLVPQFTPHMLTTGLRCRSLNMKSLQAEGVKNGEDLEEPQEVIRHH